MHDPKRNIDIFELDAVVSVGRPIRVNYRIQNREPPYFPALGRRHGYRHILGVSKSHVFVCNRLGHRCHQVMVFNDVGENVRSFTDFPGRLTQKLFVSETRHELFLAVDKFDHLGYPTFQGIELAAYCLSEPI